MIRTRSVDPLPVHMPSHKWSKHYAGVHVGWNREARGHICGLHFKVHDICMVWKGDVDAFQTLELVLSKVELSMGHQTWFSLARNLPRVLEFGCLCSSIIACA